LDLSNNKIEDARIIDILDKLPNLGVLNMTGNGVTRNIPNYRKTLVCRLKNLKYLDDRPIFPEDRRLSEAWLRGGIEEEQKERELIRKEEQDRDRRNFEALEQLQLDYQMQRKNKKSEEDAEEEEVSDDQDCIGDPCL
jgi:dynein assembly factor 1